MSTSFKVTVPVATEPITLADAKAWLRVDWSDDDALIGLLISRARSYAETITHRAFASQTIQQVDTIERPVGGELSGAIQPGINWYQYEEQLGASPFGPAQYYYSLAMPPIQIAQPITIETRVVAFDPWQSFPQVTNPDGSTNTWIDDSREPARIYIQNPITSNFWRFTFTAGYTTSYPLPPDLRECLFDLVAYLYDNRDGTNIPDTITNRLLARRVDWI